MVELSRREMMVSTAVTAALAAGVPAVALGQTANASAAWDLSDLYPSDAAWESERKAILAALPKLKAQKGTLSRSAAALRAVLLAQSEISERVSRLYSYAQLKADEDRRVGANQERKQQATDVFTAIAEATAWTSPEIVALGSARLEKLIAADAVLKKRFAFGLRYTLRLARHTLSSDGEQLLAASGSALAGPQDIREQLASSDIPRPTVTLSDGRTIRLDDQGYGQARSANNRADRKMVFDKYWASYKAFENSLGVSLASQVKGQLFQAKARHYDSALQASLDASNLPEAVYRSLIAETNRGLPVLHRYFALRAKMLGISDMGYWDIYPPLVKSDRTYSLAEMRQLTSEAIRPLGDDYVKLFLASSAKRWVDPFPRPGKASGAYMQPTYGVHPYLMLNLTDKYSGLTEYAHEWGHAMHTMIADAAQPYDLASYPTFTAEVASTNHELLLANMMVDRAKTKEDKFFYLGSLMENYRGTFFRQSMFAEFQLAVNDLGTKGEGLSGEKIAAIYLDILKRYHGPNVRIEADYGAEWSAVPHFYFGFYVWQYATSITAANFFAQKLMHGTPADRERYLTVLRSGGSDYGYNLLKKGGLDMATAEPYRLIVESFSKVLDQAEALLA